MFLGGSSEKNDQDDSEAETFILQRLKRLRTRENRYKLEKLRFRADIGRYWFTKSRERLE